MDRIVVRWQAMIVACVLMVAVFGFVLHDGMKNMSALREQETELQKNLTRLQTEQLELTKQIDAVGTSSYIELRAREDYAFLKRGELRFEITNPEVLEGYTREELQILLDEMASFD